MSSLPAQLSARIEAVAGIDPELRSATRPQFGHFQSNVALRLAKSEGQPPRAVAQRIVDQLDVGDLCEPVEIAGPGFLNFRLRADVLAAAVTDQLADPDHGVASRRDPAARGDRLLGAERGQADARRPPAHHDHRRLPQPGADRASGTPCCRRTTSATGAPSSACWSSRCWTTASTPPGSTCRRPRSSTSGPSTRFKTDPEFADRARRRVVALQSGDERPWRSGAQLIDISLAGFNATYDRLNVLLTDDHLAGESILQRRPRLVAAELEASGTAVIDHGALVRLRRGLQRADDRPQVRRRVRLLDHRPGRHPAPGPDYHADRIIYVTDAPAGRPLRAGVRGLRGWPGSCPTT